MTGDAPSLPDPLEASIPKEVFKAEVRAWAGRIGVEPKAIIIRDMTRKWASCSKDGRLTFDIDLLYQPADFRRRAIVHELLHTEGAQPWEALQGIGERLPGGRREMRREGKFIMAIRVAVRDHRLQEPFRAEDVRRAVPGFAHKTYNNFLPKHRRGNPGGNTELFDQVGPGLYRLIR